MRLHGGVFNEAYLYYTPVLFALRCPLLREIQKSQIIILRHFRLYVYIIATLLNTHHFREF